MNERGFAMYAALIALVLAAGVVTALTQLSFRDTVDTRLESARAVTLAAADGGIELARARLAQDAGFATERTTIGAATVEVHVEGAAADESFWTVRSTATTWPSGPRGRPVVHTVEAELRGRSGLPDIIEWRSR